MADGQKSPFRQAIEALERTKRKAEGMKETGEKLMGEGVRTLVSAATSFGAGLLEQRYGAVDAETGLRVHKVNGAPTTALCGLALKGAAAFGVFGKFDVPGFAAGDGALCSASNTWGRGAGERLRRKSEATTTQQPASSKKEPAAKKAA
jgi:hypothetical protein